ncbi:MAG: AgmX/PglI C-terminal domain-containing protein [Deltaproteobacteria bacterium]|nr:AgmX/PglI C-terminal domain-containing protein [Deltaproteobacteria bacterium]
MRWNATGTCVVAAALALAALDGGCKKDAPACATGEQQPCGCPDGSAGTRSCWDDGSRWGDCQCGVAAAAPPGAGAVAVVGGSAGAAGTDASAASASDAGDTGGGDGAPERVVIGGPSITAEQVAAIQARVETELSMENILGPAAGSGATGGGEFTGEGSAVSGLHDALAGAAGGGPDAGGTDSTAAASPVRGRVRTSGASPAGGSGRLSGSVFSQTLARKRGAIEACYNNALARSPEVGGDLIFLITIGTEGAVSVEVEQNSAELQAAGVTDCIVARLRTMNFTASPPEGGEFRVRLPMSLLPPEGA